MLQKAMEEFVWITILAVLFGAAFLLAGCETAKTIIDTCRDGLCR